MRVHVKTPTKRIVSLIVKSMDTVMTIMTKIQDMEGTPPDQQRLVFDDHMLQERRILKHCGVEPEALLSLMDKLATGIV